MRKRLLLRPMRYRNILNDGSDDFRRYIGDINIVIKRYDDIIKGAGIDYKSVKVLFNRISDTGNYTGPSIQYITKDTPIKEMHELETKKLRILEAGSAIRILYSYEQWLFVEALMQTDANKIYQG